MTSVDGGWSGLPATVLLLSAAAWLIAFAAHVGGWGQRLSHDRIIDEGAGLLQTVVVFLGGWQMMVAAMMLPASLAASRRFETVRADPVVVDFDHPWGARRFFEWEGYEDRAISQAGLDNCLDTLRQHGGLGVRKPGRMA